MSEGNPPEDALTLEGVGGLFNGEAYVLMPGQSASVGASSLASFSVTVCRNYRRLESATPLGSLLSRMAPEHLRFVYLGEGRLIVENLAGRYAKVGRRPFERRSELDLRQGRVEIEFGYGERLLASVPGSPAELVEFAPPVDEAAEVEGVFMALLAPSGRLRESLESQEALTIGPPPEDPPPTTEAIATEEPDEAGAEETRRPRQRTGFFRKSPALLISVLFHAVVILGLFSYMTILRSRERAFTTEVTVKAPETYITPADPVPAEPPDQDAVAEEAPDEGPALPSFEEQETGEPSEAEDTGVPSEVAPGPPGEGLSGLVGVGPGGVGAAPGSRGSGRVARKRGGAVDAAVDRALAWLARHRLADGSWGGEASLSCGRCTGAGRKDYRGALTGLSLLAFVGAGHTHRGGEHREVVKAAARYLVGRQTPDGSFHPKASLEPDEREMYGEAMATLALSELYRASGSSFLRAPVERGVRFIERAQAPYAGWRYRPHERESDTSVTGWEMLALVSAGRAGIRVNPAAYVGVRTWLGRMTEPGTYRVGYNRRGRGSVGMTATALSLRLLMRDRRAEPEVRGGAKVLAANLPVWPATGEPSPAGNPPDICYWYFGTLASHRLGDSEWRDWSRALGRALLPRQDRSGHESGSWPAPGRWSRIGGRVFTTAMGVLILELIEEYETAFR
ncbi:MAG: hypothetical protein ACYS99_09255 [Planctomycetota bacterium]|jgi:hypothetical protein